MATAPNIFATAPVIKTESKKSKADNRPVFAVEGLGELAVINVLIATLGSLKAEVEERVKGQGFDIYVDQAEKTRDKVEAFNLVDERATGQYQFKKRSSTSALSDAEIELLESFKIPVEKNKKVEGRFVFNPEALADPATAQKISNALTKIPELKGLNIVSWQDEISNTVVSDGAIEQACKTVKGHDKLVEVLRVIGVEALKTKFDSEEIKDAFEFLAKKGIKLVPDEKAKKGKK